MIPCELYNIKTKEIVKAKSVKSFCQTVGLTGKNDIVHIYPVVKGIRIHHKGWCLPETARKQYEFRDIYGNKYSGSLIDLREKYGFSYFALTRLLNGKKKISRGLFLNNGGVNYVSPRALKPINYTVKDKNGQIFKGKSMRKLAQQMQGKICYHSIRSMINGYQDQCKGHTVSDIEFERRSVVGNYNHCHEK